MCGVWPAVGGAGLRRVYSTALHLLHRGLGYNGYECIEGLYGEEAISLLKRFYETANPNIPLEDRGTRLLNDDVRL
jgi:hypothetical protein